MIRFRRDDSAQAIVLIAIVSTVLVLGIGLAIDSGQLYVARRQLQAAADSAAWAGAVVIYEAGVNGFSDTTGTNARNAAVTDAGRNGYTITTGDVQVPPTSGVATGDRGFVEVAISAQVTTFFFPGPQTVIARAVAGTTRTGVGEAILITRTSSTALVLEDARILVNDGSIFVRSTSSSSVNIDSPTPTPAISTAPSASPMRTRGGFDGSDHTKVRPSPIESASPDVPDPFSGLPSPRPFGCDPAAPLAACATRTEPPSPTTLQPGDYTGAVTLDSGTWNMATGTYIFERGLVVSGSASLIAPSEGVLIYNANSSYPSTGSSCDPITFNTSGTVTLRPRTTGTYAGITLMYDRQCGATGDRLTFGPNTGARNLFGTFYVPSPSLTDGAIRLADPGSSYVTTSITGQLVTWTYEGEDQTVLNLTYDRTQSAGGRAPVLIE